MTRPHGARSAPSVPRPKLGIYAYPWDAARLGIDRMLGELADLGFNGVDLCANYHAIGAFSPRGDAPAVFFAPRGGVYFPARRKKYGGIAPPESPDELRSVWPTMDQSAQRRGIELNAWTIGMFQPWLAQEHPSTARVLATGQRSDVGICPSNPAVVEFYADLVSDLTDQFKVHQIRLEGVGFPPLEYGWVRGRFLTPLNRSGRWNLALCFCDSCTARGRAAGIDTAALQERTVNRVRCGIGYEALTESETWRSELTSDDPELARYLSVADASVTSFVRTVAQAAAAHGTGTWLCTPQELCGSQSPPLPDVVDVLTGAMARPPRRDPNEIWPSIDDLRSAVSTIRELARAAGRTVEISAFALTVDPTVELTGERALAYLRDIVRAGPDEVLIYNYGLLTESILATLVRTIQDARRWTGG